MSQDRPTAAELVDALRGFLEQDVAPKLEGRDRFQMRVALNVLAILRRELTTPDDEPAIIAKLLGQGRTATDLAAAIRSGELDDRWDETLDAVRRIVDGKLRVANPDYASPAASTSGAASPGAT